LSAESRQRPARRSRAGQVRRNRSPQSGWGLLQGRRLRSWGRLPAAALAGNQCYKNHCGGAQKSSFGKRLDFFFIGKGCPDVKAAGPGAAALWGFEGLRPPPPKQRWFLSSACLSFSVPAGKIGNQRPKPLQLLFPSGGPGGSSPRPPEALHSSLLLRPLRPWALRRRRRRPVPSGRCRAWRARVRPRWRTIQRSWF